MLMIFHKNYIHDKISIGITTFEDRFDKYFVPLVSRIRDYDNIEKEKNFPSFISCFSWPVKTLEYDYYSCYS